MTLKLNIVNLAWEPVTGSSSYDILLDGTKVAQAGPRAKTTKINIPEGAQHKVTIKAQPSGQVQEAKFQWSSVTPPPPVGGNPYLEIDFSNGHYYGQGVATIFEASQSDSRLNSWGGMDAVYYDQLGMSTDQAQRVHLSNALLDNPSTSSGYASWQELRSTDGPWQISAPNLAKSSLICTQADTWGPGGFAWGIERWFACDFLIPLNVGGVSFELVDTWNVAGWDLHPASGSAIATMECFVSPWSGNPRYLTLRLNPQNGIPETYVNLVQLTDGSGNKAGANYNVWHELVVGLKTANTGMPGNSPGWVEIWLNGSNIRPREPRPTFLANESGPYLQFQNYTAYPTKYVGGATRSALVCGGLRAGLTRADVQARE